MHQLDSSSLVKGRARQIQLDRFYLEVTEWGGVWFDWLRFNRFDRYFQAMDSAINGGDSERESDVIRLTV